MPVFVSAVAALLAIVVIFVKGDSSAKSWAFGIIGTLVGYWLIPRPRS
jgi:uncharacterized membrane protein